MRFQCPACDHEGVTNLIPAGEFRYGLCGFCASYFLNPMPGRRRVEKELERQEALLAEPQPASRSAQRQVVGALRRSGQAAGTRIGTNLDTGALPGAFDWVPLASLREGSEQLDGIALLGFIETCADPSRTIGLLKAQLRPGAPLVLTAANARFAARVMAMKESRTPNIANVGALMRPDRRKIVFTPKGIVELLGRTGFDRIRVTSAAPTFTDRSTSHVQVLTYAASRLIDLVAPRLTLAGSILCSGLRKE